MHTSQRPLVFDSSTHILPGGFSTGRIRRHDVRVWVRIRWKSGGEGIQFPDCFRLSTWILPSIFSDSPLARIIHDCEDTKSLFCYKHVVETVFVVAREAFACPTIARHSVCCSPIFSPSLPCCSSIIGRAVPMAEPCC